MTSAIENKLIIAISSRALFDLNASNAVFEKQGVAAYAKYQIEHEDTILQPGPSFNLVKKLLSLNQYGPYVEVVLLSRNSADTGLRIFNSIAHYKLDITRAVFTSGNNPYNYANAFHSHLFLSTNPEDVKSALKAGLAAANIFNGVNNNNNNSDKIHIAFDGDAVLFSDESERIFHEQGLEAFIANETKTAKKPLKAGPFWGFLAALHQLQNRFPKEKCPIRTALITARSAPTHERVIRTFRAWKIRIDEAVFLGGLDKGEFLRAFNADIFFDDQCEHCDNSSQYVTTGHVPHGIKNQNK